MFFWHCITVKEYNDLKASTLVIPLKFYKLQNFREKWSNT